jgi:hypothetical protein
VSYEIRQLRVFTADLPPVIRPSCVSTVADDAHACTTLSRAANLTADVYRWIEGQRGRELSWSSLLHVKSECIVSIVLPPAVYAKRWLLHSLLHIPNELHVLYVIHVIYVLQPPERQW